MGKRSLSSVDACSFTLSNYSSKKADATSFNSTTYSRSLNRMCSSCEISIRSVLDWRYSSIIKRNQVFVLMSNSILFFPRFILLIALILMNIYKFINLLIPSLQITKFGSSYSIILPAFFLSAAVLWIFGAFISTPAYNWDYEHKIKRE